MLGEGPHTALRDAERFGAGRGATLEPRAGDRSSAEHVLPPGEVYTPPPRWAGNRSSPGGSAGRWDGGKRVAGAARDQGRGAGANGGYVLEKHAECPPAHPSAS